MTKLPISYLASLVAFILVALVFLGSTIAPGFFDLGGDCPDCIKDGQETRSKTIYNAGDGK